MVGGERIELSPQEGLVSKTNAATSYATRPQLGAPGQNRTDTPTKGHGPRPCAATNYATGALNYQRTGQRCGDRTHAWQFCRLLCSHFTNRRNSWYGKKDSNLHAHRQPILNRSWLPFHHSRKTKSPSALAGVGVLLLGNLGLYPSPPSAPTRTQTE